MQRYAAWSCVIAVAGTVTAILLTMAWRKEPKSPLPKKKNSPKRSKENNTGENNDAIDKCQNSVSSESVNEENGKNGKISELHDRNWIKIGKVEELYIYPMKSGRGKELQECNFTQYGVSMQKDGKLTVRDRMFLVYNEETGRFQTGRQYPTMILVSLSAVDESKVKMEAVGMPSVVFSLPKDSKNKAEAIECKMWWGEPIKCIDCGPDPAEWLSRFLTGTNSGLRLGYTVMDERNLTTGPWEKYAKVYTELQNEDAGLFSDLSSYMLMTTNSVEKLNEKLERAVPALQFRPNILVSADEPFAEDNWEWIKIGDRAVIRNVKPCSRCKMTKIDPETGIMAADEPLKTLYSFREQTNPERVAVEGKSPLLGINCGLYMSGKVKVGDDVYVHVSDEASERSNHCDANSTEPTQLF